jgi:type II secretory pathway pseudopilin PulG
MQQISTNLNKFQSISRAKRTNFTLIEILIAVGIFIILVVAAMNIYAVSVQRHRQGLKIQTVIEELSYPIEVMARDIKGSYIMASSLDKNTIYLNHPTKNINSPTCKIDNYPNGCLQYRFNSAENRIEVQGEDDSDFVPLTSSKIIVEDASFNIDITPGEVQDQPKITVLIKAKEKNDLQNLSETFLQITISQKEIINLYRGAL